jgi:hypothetical protein
VACHAANQELLKKLYWGISGYTISGMRLQIHTLRSTVAVGLSVWLAVLACLMGCTLPGLASPRSSKASSVNENPAEQNSPDLMADMESCPHHHFGGSAPAKPKDGKPAGGGNMSCCPVEVTVAAKPDIAKLGITLAQDFVLLANTDLATTRFSHAAESVPHVSHRGRDTLLETHLLRI